MRTKSNVIVTSLDLYFEGLSVRKVQRQIAKIFEVKISQVSIWKWVMKYSALAKEFVDALTPQLAGQWHIDETMIKCNGNYKWFWEMIDNETKFMVATHLSGDRTIKEALSIFKQAKERAFEKPNKIMTDGLWAYEKAFKKAFYSRYKADKVELIRRVGIRTRETNNVVERLHGTLKDRLKPMRGLKSKETAQIFLDGWFVFYNFLRPHQSINGNTPAKVSGVNIEVENWKFMIQKATKFQAVNSA
jgi:transposase-like protein